MPGDKKITQSSWPKIEESRVLSAVSSLWRQRPVSAVSPEDTHRFPQPHLQHTSPVLILLSAFWKVPQCRTNSSPLHRRGMGLTFTVLSSQRRTACASSKSAQLLNQKWFGADRMVGERGLTKESREVIDCLCEATWMQKPPSFKLLPSESVREAWWNSWFSASPVPGKWASQSSSMPD